MKPLTEMLRALSRADVVEFAVVTDRLPCVKVGEEYEPVDDAVQSTEAIMAMLVTIGGSRYVEELPSRPAHWTTRVEGVGVVGVSAIMRAGRVQARFTLVKRPSVPPHRSRPPTGRRSPSRPPPAPISLAEPDPVSPSNPFTIMHGAVTPEPMLSAAVVSATPARRPARASASPLDEALIAAREAGASDLHIVAGRPLLLRVGGELAQRGEAIDSAAVEAMLLPIVPALLQPVLTEHGSCDFALQRPSGRFRVNVARQRSGLKACFRCIAAEVPTLASLGLPPEIERATHHHQGLVLVTGPTGHGKTSTLAAIVDIINTQTSHHVITVEDPVEYVHPRKKAMISQREVGTHTRSFQSALKASLREDPDVIVVGELRDTDTVRMALAASETGHLVVGTMNTPSAAKTIDRLIDLFPPADQQQVRMTLAGGLHLVVGQRLVPAEGGGPAEQHKGASTRSSESERAEPHKPRVAAAVELLPGSVALWSLIRDGKTYQIPSLQQRGKGVGIMRLDDSLTDLVRSGRVSRAAALAVAESPDELDAVLSGKRAAANPAAPAPPPQGKPDGQGLLGKAGQLFKPGRGS